MKGYNLRDIVMVPEDYIPRANGEILPEGGYLYNLGISLRGRQGTIYGSRRVNFQISVSFDNIEFNGTIRTVHWGFDRHELYPLNTLRYERGTPHV